MNKTRKNEGLVVNEDGDHLSVATTVFSQPGIFKEMTPVQAALHRKKISDRYHTTVPKFLRAQGPFTVYDHAAHKGDRTYQTIGRVNEQALNRFT